MEKEIRNYAEARMNALDEQCRNAIVGSKILHLTIEPIKRTKHMFRLIIHTDATPIREGNVVHCCNEINVKVRF